jgi:hypothetical protein
MRAVANRRSTSGLLSPPVLVTGIFLLMEETREMPLPVVS